jgi:hypothetical protein
MNIAPSSLSCSQQLLSLPDVNEPPTRSKPAQRQLNRMLLICETVNAQLPEQLHMTKHYAKSSWGVMVILSF